MIPIRTLLAISGVAALTCVGRHQRTIQIRRGFPTGPNGAHGFAGWVGRREAIAGVTVTQRATGIRACDQIRATQETAASPVFRRLAGAARGLGASSSTLFPDAGRANHHRSAAENASITVTTGQGLASHAGFADGRGTDGTFRTRKRNRTLACRTDVAGAAVIAVARCASASSPARCSHTGPADPADARSIAARASAFSRRRCPPAAAGKGDACRREQRYRQPHARNPRDLQPAQTMRQNLHLRKIVCQPHLDLSGIVGNTMAPDQATCHARSWL